MLPPNLARALTKGTAHVLFNIFFFLYFFSAGMAYTNLGNQFMGHAVDKSFDIASDQVLADSSTFIVGANNVSINCWSVCVWHFESWVLNCISEEAHL